MVFIIWMKEIIFYRVRDFAKKANSGKKLTGITLYDIF